MKLTPEQQALLYAASATLPVSVLTRKQVIKFERQYTDDKVKYRCKLKIRYDDDCNNGHNSFAMTADIDMLDMGYWREYMGGCCHEEIAKAFPEFAKYIKWHLMSSDEPMHYISNTVYHAGDKDCWGLRKGEERQILCGGDKNKPSWTLMAFDSEGNRLELYELPKQRDGKRPTGEYTVKWVPWMMVGEGKARELDYARRTAVWPEATDDELMAPDLTEKLIARLPALMHEFKADMEALGFIY